MNAAKIEGSADDKIRSSVSSRCLLIHAKRSGPATHAHGAALGLPAGIDAQRDGRRYATAAGDRCDALGFAQRFNMDFSDALRQNQFQLRFGLSGAGEDDLLRVGNRRLWPEEFAGRGDLQPGALGEKALRIACAGVGFYRVVDGELRRQSVAQEIPFLSL